MVFFTFWRLFIFLGNFGCVTKKWPLGATPYSSTNPGETLDQPTNDSWQLKNGDHNPPATAEPPRGAGPPHEEAADRRAHSSGSRRQPLLAAPAAPHPGVGDPLAPLAVPAGHRRLLRQHRRQGSITPNHISIMP